MNLFSLSFFFLVSYNDIQDRYRRKFDSRC